ncbi:MAG: TM0106 family RecB-like putative nuclease [Acidimicrobiales bacterium]|nr:TM0106 family RecB-like putative nuclease [Acidimicrobiales bacterium]
MTDRLLTPSKITAWLDCAHYLTLRHQVEAGTLSIPRQPFGALAQLLLDKGLQHEADCLAEYRRQGRSVLEIPARLRNESFADWIARVGSPFDAGYDVIYQMPFVHEGVRGIADFLVRVEDEATGSITYEPVDAKLARAEAKPGHVLQLCFYAEALEAATGTPPERIHLWLGSGQVQSLLTADFRSYWNRLRGQLATLLDSETATTASTPQPCSHCDFCEFFETCEHEWRSADSLIYVAGIRQSDRAALESSGARTLSELAVRDEPVDDLQPERLRRLVEQAALQVEARDDPGPPPPFRIIEPGDDPMWGHGFDVLPEPDDGDVFLDFEGHPFWQADAGLFFLLGYIVRGGDGDWCYETIWAHDRDEEAAATQQLIDFLVQRRAAHPGMHVYHYNHTERSALERLAADHGVGEVALDTLVETGLFVDLLVIVRNALQVGTESYGLKHIEQLTEYARGHDIDQGSGAVVEYETYIGDLDPTHLDRIAAYNEDDVRATRALRDWLVAERPPALAWRAAYIEPEEAKPELDAQVAALHAFGPETPEHLLGDLLGYWLREYRAHIAPKLAKTAHDTPSLLDDPEVIAGMELMGQTERLGKNDRVLTPAMSFRWPDQEIAADLEPGGMSSVVYSTAGWSRWVFERRPTRPSQAGG